MKLVRGTLSTIFLVGLVMGGCAPPDPVQGGGGTGGQTRGGNAATDGNNASGGAFSGGATGNASGGAVGTGGRSSSGGTPGTGGGNGGGISISIGGGGSGGTATGGRAVGATGGGAGIMGGGTGGSAGSMPTFAPVATILGNSCGTGTCHQGGTHVDLRNNAGLRSRLVSVMVSGTATMSACRTKTLVVPGNTAMSVVSQVIKATLSGCTGTRMPDNCSTTSTTPRACLTAAQIATIDGWIGSGAGP